MVSTLHAQTKAVITATIRRIPMNKDQVSGKVEQAVGKVKQSVGEALSDEKLANQGVVDQAKGAAKETWGNAKDERCNRQGTREAEQDRSVSAKRQGESQREDRR